MYNLFHHTTKMFSLIMTNHLCKKYILSLKYYTHYCHACQKLKGTLKPIINETRNNYVRGLCVCLSPFHYIMRFCGYWFYLSIVLSSKNISFSVKECLAQDLLHVKCISLFVKQIRYRNSKYFGYFTILDFVSFVDLTHRYVILSSSSVGNHAMYKYGKFDRNC